MSNLQDEFKMGAINNWPEALDQQTVLAHLQFAATTMGWFQGEGKMLLESEMPLSHQSFRALLQNGCNLLCDFPTTRSVVELFRLILQRGIVDFVALAMGDGDKARLPLLFNDITYQLQPGVRHGLVEQLDHNNNARDMLNPLIPAVQVIKDPEMIRQIAEFRFPQDVDAQHVFIRDHTNWK